MFYARMRPHTRLRFIVAALAMAGTAALAGAPPSVTPAQAAACFSPCLDFGSGLPGARLLVDPPSGTGYAVTNSTPIVFGWHVAFPNPTDSAHGRFQLISSTSGDCLTNAQSGEQLIIANCRTSSDPRQYWYFQKGTMTKQVGGGIAYYDLVSAATGECVTVNTSRDVDGAAVSAAACGNGANQQWLVKDALLRPGSLAAVTGGAATAGSLATDAPADSSCGKICLELASGLGGGRMLNETTLPTTTELAQTARWTDVPGWNVSFPTPSDHDHGRFQLVAPDNQRCLTDPGSYTELTTTQCTTGNNRQYWTFTKGTQTDSVTGASYYILKSNSGKCAAVANSTDADSVPVVLAPCANSPSQQWLVEDATAAAGSGSALSVLSGTATAASFETAKNAYHLEQSPNGSYSFSFSTHLSGGRSIYAPGGSAGLVTESAATSFAVHFESTSDQNHGYFQLVHPSGLCLTDPGDTAQLTLATCVNQEGTDADNRQQWYLTKQTGGYWLRSKYDSHCVDVSGNNSSSGAAVISYGCWLESPAANQVWTLSRGANWSPSADSATVADALVAAQTAGATADARAANNPSKITFCNHGAYVAEGVIERYDEYDANDNHTGAGPWSTPVIPAGSCSSFTIPAGRGVIAHVSMHEYTNFYNESYGWDFPPGLDANGYSAAEERANFWLSNVDNDHVVATFTLAAPYTNTEFDFYGTTCGPSYGIQQNDAASRLGTSIVATNEPGGCDAEVNGGGIFALIDASEGVEDLFDGLAEIMQWVYAVFFVV